MATRNVASGRAVEAAGLANLPEAPGSPCRNKARGAGSCLPPHVYSVFRM